MLINLEGMPLLLTAALMTETRQKVVSFLSTLQLNLIMTQVT